MRAFALIFLVFGFEAIAESRVACQYAFYGAPFTKIEVVIYDDGEPAPSVLITPTGATSPQKATATPEVRAENEYIHLWIAKEDPNNMLEMIVYKEKLAGGQSKLINPNAPFVKEMWGDCSGMP